MSYLQKYPTFASEIPINKSNSAVHVPTDVYNGSMYSDLFDLVVWMCLIVFNCELNCIVLCCVVLCCVVIVLTC